MLEKKFKITSSQGLHARPATHLVRMANDYDCEIRLTLDKTTVDFNSIMGVMSLGAYQGEVITLSCNGSDEKAAMDAISFEILDMALAKEL